MDTQKQGLELPITKILYISRFKNRGCVIFGHFLKFNYFIILTYVYSKGTSWAAGFIIDFCFEIYGERLRDFWTFFGNKHVWTIACGYLKVKSSTDDCKNIFYFWIYLKRLLIFGFFYIKDMGTLTCGY